jgi:plastocyanin
MPKRLVVALCALLLAAGCGGDGNGGVTNPPGRGTLDGVVTGPGGPVPDALVVVTGVGQQQTNSDGRFNFTNVEPGSKTLSVSPPAGWELAAGEVAQKSATVAAGATVSVNWSLRLGNTTARTVEVGLAAASFNARDVTIPAGSTIRWVNQTAITHTISPTRTTQAGTWTDVTISGQGTEFEHTFGAAGTFDYVCKLHSGMTGVVRVH